MNLPLGKVLDIHILGTEKVCSYSCVYCEHGRTTMTMNQIRREYQYPSLEAILSLVKQQVIKAVEKNFDFLALAGNGEPLLHPQITEIIDELIAFRNQEFPNAKFLILSNGAHIQGRKIIQSLNKLDERIFKLDAGNNSMLKKVNAPLVRLTVDRLAQDIKKLTDCSLQSTFIQGAVDNTSPDHIEDWLEIVGMIQPKKLYLVTPQIYSVSEDTLETIASRARRRLPSVEISVFTGQSPLKCNLP